VNAVPIVEPVFVEGTQSGNPSCIYGDPVSREITVIFTNPRDTLAAMRAAVGWNRNWSPRLLILAAHVVPYPLALAQPAVDLGALKRAMLRVGFSAGVEANVQIYLCRDLMETIDRVVHRGATVVVGARKYHWLGTGQRIARALTRSGRTVLLVHPETS
jgi:hypothetical protein